MSLYALLSRGQLRFFMLAVVSLFAQTYLWNVPITGVFKILFSWWKAADAVFADFMLLWWLEISNKQDKMEKPPCKCVGLLLLILPMLLWVPSKQFCCWGSWGSFCDGMAVCSLQGQGICSAWELRGLAYGEVSSFPLLNICNKFTFPEFPSYETCVFYSVISFISCSVGDNYIVFFMLGPFIFS